MNQALIVTSIAYPTRAMQKLAEGALVHGFKFYCVGDRKSPEDFALGGCQFVSLKEQRTLPFRIAKVLPMCHYSRKNIGYLLAINMGAERIVETDDDNVPLGSFWVARQSYLDGDLVSVSDWVNAYAYFTDGLVWPRGFPLEKILESRTKALSTGVKGTFECPVQQGLANGDTDVDAIYRLTRNDPVTFRKRRPIVLDIGSWCLFNSQCTIWWPKAYPLMYLPSCCSFRMTDIWRSFVAQACLWAVGCRIAFVGPAMHQERNQHDLLEDFQLELDGYLHNAQISNALMGLDLRTGEDNLMDNLVKCYRCLVKLGLVEMREFKLLDAWIADITTLLEVPK
ncbi:MAG: STELLO glycosyltransferase family protein [Anaerolineae bacterium]|nr:STELLO glycosyltransferase family protein [Anaerolineae bacterium]